MQSAKITLKIPVQEEYVTNLKFCQENRLKQIIFETYKINENFQTYIFLSLLIH